MQDHNIRQIENMWGFEMGYNLSGAALAGLKDWLGTVPDGELSLVESGVRSIANGYEATGRRPAPRLLMQKVNDQRAKANISKNDDTVEKVHCSLCHKTGQQWVLLAYSDTEKRRKPYPNNRKAQALKEVYCIPQPCYCSNGDGVNGLPQWSYTPQKRRKISELYGMPYKQAVEKQMQMIHLWGEIDHQPTYKEHES